MDKKTLGWIQTIGALLAGWFAWQEMDMAALVFAAMFLIMGVHHLRK